MNWKRVLDVVVKYLPGIVGVVKDVKAGKK